MHALINIDIQEAKCYSESEMGFSNNPQSGCIHHIMRIMW